jgi:hypothetical protein
LKTRITLLEIDSTTLQPINDIPRRDRYRAIWYLAMIYLGARTRAGRRLVQKLKSETLTHLQGVNAKAFGGTVYDQTIQRQLDAAWDACAKGKNNLFRMTAANDNGVYQIEMNCRG